MRSRGVSEVGVGVEAGVDEGDHHAAPGVAGVGAQARGVGSTTDGRRTSAPSRPRRGAGRWRGAARGRTPRPPTSRPSASARRTSPVSRSGVWRNTALASGAAPEQGQGRPGGPGRRGSGPSPRAPPARGGGRRSRARRGRCRNRGGEPAAPAARGARPAAPRLEDSSSWRRSSWTRPSRSRSSQKRSSAARRKAEPPMGQPD